MKLYRHGHWCIGPECGACPEVGEQRKAESDEPMADRECDALENAYEKAMGW